jgi:hypothetical protein
VGDRGLRLRLRADGDQEDLEIKQVKLPPRTFLD